MSTRRWNPIQSIGALGGFITYGFGSQFRVEQGAIKIVPGASLKSFMFNAAGAMIGSQLGGAASGGSVGRQMLIPGVISSIPGIWTDQINLATDIK